jgi:acetate kinase
MPDQGTDDLILVINAGSSSLKIGLYRTEIDDAPLLEGLVDGIGEQSCFSLSGHDGKEIIRHTDRVSSTSAAFDIAIKAMLQYKNFTPSAIGHRVVHGGPNLTTHQRITEAVLAELKRCVHFAPLHIPASIALIEQAEKMFPSIKQFACFDTAFHQSLPEIAARFPLPRELFVDGLRRYGFHGLSYESIVYQLSKDLPKNLIIAHLGNGASLCAVSNGRSMDTSMGLTPTGGIPMSRRSGDLDPGVLLYLLRTKHLTVDSLEHLLNHSSGLYALSSGIDDMRALEAAVDNGNADAQLAIDAFSLAIAKTVASYAVVLGGIDMLVFSGGIGEHSETVRINVCKRLGFVSIPKSIPSIDDQSKAPQIRVIPSREDEQIARHCRHLLAQ